MRTGSVLGLKATIDDEPAWAVRGDLLADGLRRPPNIGVWLEAQYQAIDDKGLPISAGPAPETTWTSRSSEPFDLERFIQDAEALLDIFERLHDADLCMIHASPFNLHLHDEGWRFGAHPGALPRGADLPVCYGLPSFISPFAAAKGHQIADTKLDLWLIAALLFMRATKYPPPTTPLYGGGVVVAPNTLRAELPPGLNRTLKEMLTPWSAIDLRTVAELRASLREDSNFARTRSSRPQRVLSSVTCAETHVGVAKRKVVAVNQDSHLVKRSAEHSLHLLVVADGVSTAAWGSGDQASKIVTDTFEERWTKDRARLASMRQPELEAWLLSCLKQANDAILAAVNKLGAPFPELPPDVMGSTVLAAVIRDSRVSLAHMGDSPALLIRAGERIERLSREHNVKMEMLLAWRSVDEAISHPAASALTRCMGIADLDPSGHLRSPKLSPDFLHFYLQEGDILLLASDGLTDYIGGGEVEPEHIISTIIDDERDIELAALELILATNRGGGGDNITLILHKIVSATTQTANLHRHTIVEALRGASKSKRAAKVGPEASSNRGSTPADEPAKNTHAAATGSRRNWGRILQSRRRRNSGQR